LLSRRPYKAPWSLQDTLALFRDQRSRQFDPAGVDALLASVDECVAVRARFSDD
jgi:putative two-component system response regulator